MRLQQRLSAGLAISALSALAFVAGPTTAQTPEAAPPAPAPATPAAPGDASAVAAVPAPGAPPSTPPAPSVAVQSLAQLDMFSTGRDAGLGADLWKGSSADIARTIIPTLARGPLSPAGKALALRLLGQAATAPDGASSDAGLAADRARALLALGDAATVDAISDRTGNLSSNAALSEIAAEAALITDQTAKACAIGDALAVERGQVYWLRLRAFCQLLAGKADVAQLTFTLANQQQPDPVYGRLMGALIAGAGDPGQASLRNGLDYALSRQLKLNLEPALPQAAPAIAEHLAATTPPPPPPPPVAAAPGAAAPPPFGSEADVLAILRQASTSPASFAAAAKAAQPGIAALVQAKAALSNPVQLATGALAVGDVDTAQAIRAGLVQDAISNATPVDLAILDATIAVAAGRLDAPTLDRLSERGVQAEGIQRARAQAAAILFAALGAPSSGVAGGVTRGEMASFDLGRLEAPPARVLALNSAASLGLRGETGLLALSMAQPFGANGPKIADLAWIVQALNRAGLVADARAFALEGLIALQSR